MIRAGHVGRWRRAIWNRGKLAELDSEWYFPEDTEWDEKGRTMISHIYVSYDKTITSIQFGYYENEALVLSEKYGPPHIPGNFSMEFVTVSFSFSFFFGNLSTLLVILCCHATYLMKLNRR